MNILQRLAKKDKIVLGILFASFFAVAGFLVIAILMAGGHTREVDETLIRLFRNPQDLNDPLGPVAAEEAVRDITAIGGTTVLTLITVLVSTGFFLKRMPYNALALSGGYIGALILNGLLKNFFERARPEIISHHLESYSFPSGHTLLSTSVYLILGAMVAKASGARRSRIYAVSVGLLLAFMVGVSRVYLGVHYPTDVLAGWCIGLVWAMSWWLIVRRLEKPSRQVSQS